MRRCARITSPQTCLVSTGMRRVRLADGMYTGYFNFAGVIQTQLGESGGYVIGEFIHVDQFDVLTALRLHAHFPQEWGEVGNAIFVEFLTSIEHLHCFGGVSATCSTMYFALYSQRVYPPPPRE